MTLKKLTATALAATFVVGASALPGLARDGKGPARAERGFIYLLKTSDADGDGKVTKEEAIAFQNGRFAEIDVNSDGVITPGEFSDYRKARMEAFKQSHPRPAGTDAASAGDKNPAPQQKMAAQDRKTPDNRKHLAMGGDRDHGKWSKPGHRDMARIFFVRADTDRSGQLSADEFAAITEKMFTRMDLNDDMVITIDDIPSRPMMQ